MSGQSSRTAARSPDSDVSPTGQPPAAQGSHRGRNDYFPSETEAGVNQSTSSQNGTLNNGKGGGNDAKDVAVIFRSSDSTINGQASIAEDGKNGPRFPSSVSSFLSGTTADSRKSSVISVSFRPPFDPALPQGNQRRTDAQRLRNSSPTPTRFRQHVSFDNIPVGESTKNNILGYTINLTHDGYQPRRRSRTMMVGVDQHAYSDYALQWLLEEYAEDGDEVICVHVSDRESSRDDKNYKAKAEAMVDRIKQKIPPDCAISIKLEYAVGKLHETFQKLIHVYQPSMLVVGTRGRSLGGIQGLVNTRNSFSKYCLQYSPVPTVVVRDIDKRKKKKEKRTQDPSRQSYVSMLAANQGKHEVDSERSSLYELEAKLSPDEEAHQVAAALGLPASFDPTLKPFDVNAHLHSRAHPSQLNALLSGAPLLGDASSTGSTIPAPPSTLDGSEDEESGDEDEDEFEVVTGDKLRQQARRDPDQKIKKSRLHQMEVAEAAALREQPRDDDDEDEEETADKNGNHDNDDHDDDTDDQLRDKVVQSPIQKA